LRASPIVIIENIMNSNVDSRGKRVLLRYAQNRDQMQGFLSMLTRIWPLISGETSKEDAASVFTDRIQREFFSLLAELKFLELFADERNLSYNLVPGHQGGPDISLEADGVKVNMEVASISDSDAWLMHELIEDLKVALQQVRPGKLCCLSFYGEPSLAKEVRNNWYSEIIAFAMSDLFQEGNVLQLSPHNLIKRVSTEEAMLSSCSGELKVLCNLEPDLPTLFYLQYLCKFNGSNVKSRVIRKCRNTRQVRRDEANIVLIYDFKGIPSEFLLYQASFGQAQAYPDLSRPNHFMILFDGNGAFRGNNDLSGIVWWAGTGHYQIIKNPNASVPVPDSFWSRIESLLSNSG